MAIDNNLYKIISGQLNVDSSSVGNVLKMSQEGATIPFMARYRKELTGNLDEVAIENILSLYEQLEKLEKRKIAILKSIKEQEKLTDELKAKIEDCHDIHLLEDIYTPYKPKRKTKAEVARSQGLEPLAKMIMSQGASHPEDLARRFVNSTVPSVEDALQGAIEIIAEWINERISIKNAIRRAINQEGEWSSKVIKGKEDEGSTFKDYFDYQSKVSRTPGFRFLAMLRGESQGIIRLKLRAEEDQNLKKIEESVIRSQSPSSEVIKKACKEAYKRFIKTSLESEIRTLKKEEADREAISIFTGNLRQLLMMPPLGGKRILAIDPGFKSGCKVVILDEQGQLLHNENIFPHPPQREFNQAKKKLSQWVQAYKVDAIAIGNGTAGRETENLVKNTHFDREVKAFSVNEAGASIYSASSVGRKEFPQYDVTVRGAVSIGRRLQDPLAELVKIEPKNLGVGQYQHDVDQKLLQESLDRVVSSCVNEVGVEINTASEYLLKYVSGIGPKLASNIIEYRKKHGEISSRQELKKIPLMGPLAFEQSAGFIRVPNSKNILDKTAVHPERYSYVKAVAKANKLSVEDMIASELEINWEVSDEVGPETRKDIIEELKKPGRDPRSKATVFSFSDEVHKMEDLKIGMKLPGIVSNITKFGAFVDVGVKQDGLVHISQLKNAFVSDPLEVVKLGQYVNVEVVEVDIPRKRIQLSMKDVEQPA